MRKRQTLSSLERLSMEQPAEFLGVSRFTVRKWVREHRLPFHQLGRRIVLNRGDVEAFFQSGRVEMQGKAGNEAA